ncbi:glycoside hydrolase family 10 protein [uncultured Gemmiger sp.]|uniref:glycoside hydrolase family 10 protein n=1 Tax=uncultured Gemmiger sp. TaxID=1623490 RepID=UPI00266C52E6|nr:family 10 glycosylhydrolase [uncultured Gemmiger sp.]
MRRVVFYLFIIAVFLAAPLAALPRRGETAPAATPAPTATAEPTAAAPYRAVWVSYLEWQQVDFSTPETFSGDIAVILDNIRNLGATVVLAQVRPFGDALYPSSYYPFSHLCTGQQGRDPGYDPLALLVQAAHDRGLALEAWVNPYRIQAGLTPALCGASPAKLHPDWVKYTDTGAYLDPANTAVRQYIADAVGELCANYDVDGIHFDDYFYPTTDPAFDAADYAASGTALTQDDWRRENVNALVELCHATARRYGVRFGVAPVGDPEQNYALQYSDAARWLRQGTVDYLMPQLYWGQEYVKDGDTSHSLARLAGAWAALPRAAGVRLYAGLGAYRIGAGDGSDAGSEWVSGHALADQLNLLDRLGVQGAGLYRYASLFDASDYAGLAAAEVDAVRQVWQIDQRSKD